MTRTVRGAGRAKYAANRKHAQRTPLPEKDVTPTVGAKRRAVIAEAVASVKRAPEKVVVPIASPTPAVSKAQMFALAAEEAGWEVERKVKGDIKTVVATRGTEVIELNWKNGKSMSPLGVHRIGGHEQSLRHVTVSMKLLAVPAEVAANAVKPSKSSKGPSTRLVKVSVPFDPKVALDKEVLEAIAGREIHWSNGIVSGFEIEESAVVPVNGRKTRLEPDDLDDPSTRQLTFCDVLTGYRTVRLNSITRVSTARVVKEIPKK